MTTEEARKIADEFLKRAAEQSAATEHPESTRLASLATIILDLCNQIDKWAETFRIYREENPQKSGMGLRGL